jgi:hypothetical protein
VYIREREDVCPALTAAHDVMEEKTRVTQMLCDTLFDVLQTNQICSGYDTNSTRLRRPSLVEE